MIVLQGLEGDVQVPASTPEVDTYRVVAARAGGPTVPTTAAARASAAAREAGRRGRIAADDAIPGADDGTPLGDGLKHHVVIRYREPRLRIFFDAVQILLVRVHLARKLALSDGTAWVGFTGATGAGTQEHWILRFAYRSL